MNNFTSMFVAVLEHLELLTEDEARKLIKELHEATLPDSYDAASRFLKDVYKKLDVQKLAAKVPSVSSLEKKVEDLEAEVEKLKSAKPDKVVDTKK